MVRFWAGPESGPIPPTSPVRNRAGHQGNCCQILDSLVLWPLFTNTTCLCHQRLVLPGVSPMKLNFLVCFVLFSLREMCGVPEAERQQLQPCVPAERHLPGHGILGVSEGSAGLVLIPTPPSPPTLHLLLEKPSPTPSIPHFLAPVAI